MKPENNPSPEHFLELEEAVRHLKNALKGVEETEICPLLEATGRISGADVSSPINVPPFPKSAMDGYAVRSEDVNSATLETPVNLRVIGELFAGDSVSEKVSVFTGGNDESFLKNTAFRIMTGSPVPFDYDSVVKQEDTDYGKETVSVYAPVKKWQNYCKAGEDIQKGSVILRAGEKINRFHISLLSSTGLVSVKVLRKIKVSVLSTGSELTEPGKTLSEGKIYSSIGPLLYSSIIQAGQSVVRMTNIIDDEERIISSIKMALLDSDIVITTGGVSVGKKDYLPSVLDKLGAKVLFSRVKIQPGTPTTAAVLDGKLILCLSGNPYAAAANFDIYFYNALSVLTGNSSFEVVKKTAELCSFYEKVNKNRRLVRAFYEDGKVYLPAENHASSVLSNMTKCNAYLDVPAETLLKTGDKVPVWLMKC